MLSLNFCLHEAVPRLLSKTLKNFPIKFCKASVYEFDYERVKGTEDGKWFHLTGKQSTERFIPVTRKVLLKKILEDTEMIGHEDLERFQNLATGIDSMMTTHYKNQLDNLKSLYNPLSPDRDTVQMKFFTYNQLLSRKTEIIKVVSNLLSEASFYELPHNVMMEALDEKNVAEDVVVKVSPESYDVLKFWVIGMDVIPLDDRPWYVKAGERARSIKEKSSSTLDPLSKYNYTTSLAIQTLSGLWTKMYGKSFRRIARYKRVIVAFKLRRDTKLRMKSFKDIPCENLEFLLPDGKVRMGKLDKVRLSIQSSLLLLLILGTTVSNLIDLKLGTNIVLAFSAAIIFGRNISMYVNMRNRHTLRMSQTLYFKSIANSHALLPLIVDRAEDETYKAALLICAVLHKVTQRPNLDQRNGISQDEVERLVEEWLYSSFNVKINFSIDSVLDKLLHWEVLTMTVLKGNTLYKAEPIEEVLVKLPSFKRTPVLHHADLLDINFERTNISSQEQGEAYLNYEGKFDW